MHIIDAMGKMAEFEQERPADDLKLATEELRRAVIGKKYDAQWDEELRDLPTLMRTAAELLRR